MLIKNNCIFKGKNSNCNVQKIEWKDLWPHQMRPWKYNSHLHYPPSALQWSISLMHTQSKVWTSTYELGNLREPVSWRKSHITSNSDITYIKPRMPIFLITMKKHHPTSPSNWTLSFSWQNIMQLLGYTFLVIITI